MDRHPFRLAVEREDLAAAIAMLHDDVEFRSPAVHRPYEGRAAVAHLLRHAAETLEDLVYVDELHGTDGGRDTVALIFRAHVGEREVEGLDHLTVDGGGRIVRLRVMLRPLSGLIAMAESMAARLDSDPVPTTEHAPRP